MSAPRDELVLFTCISRIAGMDARITQSRDDGGFEIRGPRGVIRCREDNKLVAIVTSRGVLSLNLRVMESEPFAATDLLAGAAALVNIGLAELPSGPPAIVPSNRSA